MVEKSITFEEINSSANFENKCIQNENTKPMFPKQKRSHQMKLRKTEEFKISNAKHARLARSAILDMQ